MYKTRHILILLATAIALSLTGCQPEPTKRTFSFEAYTEQWQNDTKVHIDNNEQWIYWENGDEISIGSNTTGNTQGWLTGGGAEDWENYSSVFICALDEGSKYFLGLHPYSDHNVISYGSSDTKHHFDVAQLYLNDVQTYRTDSRGDHTFDRSVLPMVAWSGHEWDSAGKEPRLDFHTMAALVRLQFFNNTGSDQVIKQITIAAETPASGDVEEGQKTNTHLSGLFDVVAKHGANPFLKHESDGGNTITIKCANDSDTIDFKQGSLRSFYVVLPSMAGHDTSTVYRLNVTVTNANGKKFSKQIQRVRTRRRSMTYMQAIGITQFDESDGDGSIGLVGNGTEERPFKIYTAADMVYLRNCFNSDGADKYVNGQKVTAQTVFHIMNNIDVSSVWNTAGVNMGIKHFMGIMRFKGNSTSPGIINNTAAPIFEEITADGVVEGLTIKYYHPTGEGTLSLVPSNIYFSPFVRNNNGTIRDCHVTTVSGSGPVAITPTQSLKFGGICSSNTGTVENSDCTLRLSFNNLVSYGGICHDNSGEVKGCNTSSQLSIKGGSNAGGIVNTNTGTVRDCYYAAQLSNVGGTNWGGIVYSNNSGTVEHCYTAKSSTLGTKGTATIGGIVNNTNTSSSNKIDYCWNGANLSSTNVGGIIYALHGGTCVNCFIDDSSRIISVIESASDHYAGGLVATMNGGSIENSYIIISHLDNVISDSKLVAGTLVGNLTGGSLKNCYSINTHGTRNFYGNKAASGVTMSNCYQVSHTGPNADGITAYYNRNNEGDDLYTALSSNSGSGWKEWNYDETGLSNSAKAALLPWLEQYTLNITSPSPSFKHRR